MLLPLLVLVVVWSCAPSHASAQEPEPQPSVPASAALAPPRASIVVDADTGEVVTESESRIPQLPASTTKIVTALLVRRHLDLDGTIAIPDLAAFAPPRRIQLAPGSQWGVRDLLYAAMHCSCNDAAWALGEMAGGGSMEGFETEAAVLADLLGMEDSPVMRDPAGLDDQDAVGGGNLISARDLAIAARAFLADAELAAVAVAPGHEWIGGDGEPHSVRNLNAFLGLYEGAIGLKTGATERAGLTFVAAARQGGRTLIAVVLGSQDHYRHARELLDAGFLLSAAGDLRGGGDLLPPVPDSIVAGADPDEREPETTEPVDPPESGPASPVGDDDVDGAATDGADDSGIDVPTPVATLDEDQQDTTAMWVAAGSGAVAVAAGTTAVIRRGRRRRTLAPR